MDKIQLGINNKLISISEDNSVITYLIPNKKRNFNNPEEQIQAETYISLIMDYKYNSNRIQLFVTVPMGATKKEADIIVYHDDECLKPHILVECKKSDVSEAEFNQAIEQAYSYAYSLPNDIKYLWVTSGLKNEYFEVDKTKNVRVNLPDIPQFGIKKLPNYRYVYKAADVKSGSGKQQSFDIIKVNESELTNRFKKAHDALWAGGQLNPSEAFDELDKLIFCKIWDEKKPRKIGEPYDFQIITLDKSEIIDNEKRTQQENKLLAERVNALYAEGRKKDPEVFKDSIRLSASRMRTVVSYLQDINLSETDLDSKGRAFETFMDAFFRGNFGQYFTPRPIVQFITNVLPIKNDSYVLDTSCGSGGFLLYALDKVRKQADEYYNNTDIRHYQYWHNFAEKYLYAIEINEQISRAAKMNMIIHDDGHTNVISADGLLSPNKLKELTTNAGFKYNHFDFIITNPPFGSSVKKSEKNYLKNYELAKKYPDWLDTKAKTTIDERDSQSTEVLFIEQCYNFLKPYGYLAIVIPDGVLTNSTLQYVRDWIEEKYQIIAVISMPQTAFAATGAGVKSSVLVLRKHTFDISNKIAEIKLAIQNELKTERSYYTQIEKWEKEKKKRLKDLDGYIKVEGFDTISDINKTTGYKEWKDGIDTEYKEKIGELKEKLQDEYQQIKTKKLPNYQIFMAIAENIGYDATGKPTNVNELDKISEELTKFIEEIEKASNKDDVNSISNISFFH